MLGPFRGLWQVVAIVVLAAAVGGATGALLTVSLASDEESNRDSSSSQTAPVFGPTPNVRDHLEAIGMLFSASWPHVDYSEDWRIHLYNAQPPLLAEWSELGGRIYVDGIEMMRTRVEHWRERYAEWVDEAEESLQEHPPSDSHESVKAAHSRGFAYWSTWMPFLGSNGVDRDNLTILSPLLYRDIIPGIPARLDRPEREVARHDPA